MKNLLALLCFVAVGHSIVAVYLDPHNGDFQGGWGGPVVVSRRDAGEADVTSLVGAVEDLLGKAKKGMTVEELGSEAEVIRQMAATIEQATTEEVDEQKVKEEIAAVAGKFNGATSVSALFDGPMDFEASKMDSAFHLLDGLASKAKELQEAGEPVQNVVAAIAMTAAAIEDISKDVVDIVVSYKALASDAAENEKDDKNRKARQADWTAGATYSQSAGLGASVGVSWSGR